MTACRLLDGRRIAPGKECGKLLEHRRRKQPILECVAICLTARSGDRLAVVSTKGHDVRNAVSGLLGHLGGKAPCRKQCAGCSTSDPAGRGAELIQRFTLTRKAVLGTQNQQGREFSR